MVGFPNLRVEAFRESVGNRVLEVGQNLLPPCPPRCCDDTEWLGKVFGYQPDGNLLKVGIAGCKVREDRGQPLRVLEFEVEGRPELSRLMALLNVFTTSDVTYSFPKRSLTELIRKLSEKLFPECKIPPSPISFRHQFCANLKVEGHGRSEIARAMGHRSVTTQGKYGRRKNGRRGGCLPSQVSATHEIRSDSHIVSSPAADLAQLSSGPNKSTTGSKTGPAMS